MRITILIFIIFSFSFNTSAQRNDTTKIDDYKFRPGFSLGTNQMISVNGNFGFSLGISSHFKVSKKIRLYPQLLLSFFEYSDNNSTIEPVVLEVPLHIQFAPLQTKLKPIFSMGPNLKIDLSTGNLNWYGDVAIGIEYSLKYFIIAPEIRYSGGKPLQSIYLIINIGG